MVNTGKNDSDRRVTSEWKVLQGKHEKNENGYTELICLRITHNKRQPSAQSEGGRWERTLGNRAVSVGWLPDRSLCGAQIGLWPTLIPPFISMASVKKSGIPSLTHRLLCN